MEGSDLKRIGPAAALLAAVVVPLVIWSTVVDGGGGKGLPDLTVERVLGTPMLMISVADDLNTPGTALNGRTVTVECLDGAGRAVVRSTRRWPLRSEPGYKPHVHQRVPADRIDAVERCRLLGTRAKLEAEPRGFVRRPLRQGAHGH